MSLGQPYYIWSIFPKFQFLNSFLPLFYLAFYIVDVNKLQEV